MSRTEGSKRPTPEGIQDPVRLERMRQWDHMKYRLNHQAEAEYGSGVEEGIVDAVVGLNLIGITTVMSCQGHRDEIDLYPSGPWISFRDFGLEEEFERKLDSLDDLLEEFNEQAEIPLQFELSVYDDVYGERSGSYRLMPFASHELHFDIGTYAKLTQKSKEEIFEGEQDVMVKFIDFLRAKYIDQGFQL